MITRAAQPIVCGSTKSVLLLGPRQTGKSTLAAQANPALLLNLMHEPTFLSFAANPLELEQRLGALPARKPATVVLDEVQRLPSLLNTVQTVLDSPSNRFRFILTGSSARKLRRGQANLLPGRVITAHLGPLVARELQYQLPTQQALSTGTLPGIFTEADDLTRQAVLRSYAATYLKEEVQAESLTRNLEGFARFLYVVSEWAGKFLDLTKMASSAQINRQSAIRYFEVLEDCLIVFRVEAFSASATRRTIQHPRFYFFDVGVLNGLLGNFQVSSDRIGGLFEHLVITQIHHTLRALDVPWTQHTYRTEAGAEVDLVVRKPKEVVAIELKASTNVGPSDLRGFHSFADYYGKPHEQQVWYLGSERRRIGSIDILPWQVGLQQLGL